MMFVTTGFLVAADSKGFCPPTPAKPKVVSTKTSVPPTPPTPDAQYVGTVMLMAVISDKGYVCNTQVIRGVDKEIDKTAAGAVRQWHFQPARKDGRAIPVVVTVEVNYWHEGWRACSVSRRPNPRTCARRVGALEIVGLTCLRRESAC
jgi:TonB family protein